jgi:hypothetical protein
MPRGRRVVRTLGARLGFFTQHGGQATFSCNRLFDTEDLCETIHNQSEPPFAATQLVVLVLFIAVAIASATRFRIARS